MRQGLWILGVLAPYLVWAETAPEGCGSQFFQSEMPNVSSTSSQDYHLICYEQFALLHSGKTKTPVWVAEHLTAERVEAKVKRKDAFHAEKDLPKDGRAELFDYVHSGYARGHMAPSGDMSTPEAQHESFSLANMVPQNSRNNSGPWKGIEDSVRALAEREGELFIMTGPIYLSSSTPKMIGRGVGVPDKLFKAIYDPKTRQGAVYVVTNESKPSCWEISLKELINTAGLDIFPDLSPKIKGKRGILPLPASLSCPNS